MVESRNKTSPPTIVLSMYLGCFQNICMYTLWKNNMAMENGSFEDVLVPIENDYIFSIANVTLPECTLLSPLLSPRFGPVQGNALLRGAGSTTGH